MWKLGKKFLRLKELFISNLGRKKEKVEFVNLFQLNWDNLFFRSQKEKQMSSTTHLKQEERVINQVFQLVKNKNQFTNTNQQARYFIQPVNIEKNAISGIKTISSFREGNRLLGNQNQDLNENFHQTSFLSSLKNRLFSKVDYQIRDKYPVLGETSTSSFTKETRLKGNQNQGVNKNLHQTSFLSFWENRLFSNVGSQITNQSDYLFGEQTEQNSSQFHLLKKLREDHFSPGGNISVLTNSGKILRNQKKNQQFFSAPSINFIGEYSGNLFQAGKQEQLLNHSLSSVLRMSSHVKNENGKKMQINKLVENLNINVSQEKQISGSVKDEIVAVLLSALEEVS